MTSTVLTSVLTTLGTIAGAIGLSVVVPAAQAALGGWLSGLANHHFETELEELRSKLRGNEQRLTWLTHSTISLRSGRQAALYARRVDAADKLWKAKIELDELKVVAAVLAGMNLNAVIEAAEKGDDNIRSLADYLSAVAPESHAIPRHAGEENRLFVSKETWTYFAAYRGLLLYAYTTVKLLSDGSINLLRREPDITDTFVLALPEYFKYINKYGYSACYNLMVILEQKLIDSIWETLDGRSVDEKDLKRIGDIVSSADQLEAQAVENIPPSFRSQTVPKPPTPSTPEE